MAGRTGAVQRPGNARRAGDGLKLHRRAVRLDGRPCTLVGLRPGTAVRFGTNRFHGTWHVLSDRHGARVLGRLLWGLSYQARPGTLLVVDRPFLVPTPFDADPPDPIVLVPGWCTPFGRRAARDLARRLPLRAAPDGTVRWRTHGLDAALRGEPDRGRDSWRWPERSRIDRTHGLLALAPSTPREARLWAVAAARLDTSGLYDMDYTYLGEWDHGHPGEIQVFRDFHRDVSTARRARAEILAGPGAPADAAELRPLIWRRHGAIGRGRSRRVRNCRPLGRADAAALEAAGVQTLDTLARIGAVEAYLLLRDARCRPDEALLWSLEAAVAGTGPGDVPPGRRAELLRELATRTRRPGRAPGR
ncbi:TfoX/Sxy family DNA transformation protein [Actinomadura sp. WMMB 499]|uniref:TfoX/Sxy family DNA transformation protein n=1 Tax=Actinomadura sp. WMMB 499 TaxID=1219491 RepID=UPI00124856FF|nr:TfoX/Sxy family DNA transformation protein [Actinomadura sp. WMMB 499]QFG19939.1 hypothetical protein F7P10_00915 [Actinomadura sp. WMMB 499]